MRHTPYCSLRLGLLTVCLRVEIQREHELWEAAHTARRRRKLAREQGFEPQLGMCIVLSCSRRDQLHNNSGLLCKVHRTVMHTQTSGKEARNPIGTHGAHGGHWYQANALEGPGNLVVGRCQRVGQPSAKYLST